MGYDELTAALRRETEASCAQLRDQAAAESAALQASWAEEAEQLRAQSARRNAQACAAAAAAAATEARQHCERLGLESEEQLARRLRERAAALLPRLRGTHYGAAFAAMLRSLPAAGWSRARVNPADRDAAAALLPGVEIGEDPAISGGIAVETADGRMLVTDTLEKRLERFWPELLPEVLREVCDAADGEAPGKS